MATLTRMAMLTAFSRGAVAERVVAAHTVVHEHCGR